jgi:hypothetical protein
MLRGRWSLFGLLREALMIKIVARVAPVLLLVSCAATLGAPAASAAPGSRVPAFGGVVAGYTWSFNSSRYNFDGQAGAISVHKSSRGVYEVTFGNLGVMSGGMVQVTPYNFTGTCSVDGWGPNGPDLGVGVRCYSPAGSPANAQFDLLVTQPASAPPGTFDYAWDSIPASSGTLSNGYEYNSAEMSNTVQHLGTGRYQVTFGGPASSGTHGTVKVSAYGLGAGDCSASGWHGTSVGQVVNVNCYKASGAPVNRDFNVTYAGRTNLMGLAGMPTANALIGSTGRVMTQFDSEGGANVTVSHVGTGLYRVQLNKTTEHFGGGDVQVSPITGSKARCVVVGWSGGSNVKTIVTVHCFNGPGSPVNSAFAIQFVVGFLT